MENFELFTHQIGGWTRYGKKETKVSVKKQFFFNKSKLYKPLDEKEKSFYVMQYPKEKEILHDIVPEYFGQIEIDGSPHVILDNLTYRFEHPCYADIKLGTSTYPSAPERKRVSKKCPFRKKIGFRFVGMKVFHNGETFEKGKEWGKKTPPNESTFSMYLKSATLLDKKLILEELVKIRDLLSKSQFLFFASSLMFIYEGKEKKDSSTPIVKLIDFDHVYEKKEYPEYDDGVLFGIDNIIRIIENCEENS